MYFIINLTTLQSQFRINAELNIEMRTWKLPISHFVYSPQAHDSITYYLQKYAQFPITDYPNQYHLHFVWNAMWHTWIKALHKVRISAKCIFSAMVYRKYHKDFAENSSPVLLVGTAVKRRFANTFIISNYVGHEMVRCNISTQHSIDVSIWTSLQPTSKEWPADRHNQLSHFPNDST